MNFISPIGSGITRFAHSAADALKTVAKAGKTAAKVALIAMIAFAALGQGQPVNPGAPGQVVQYNPAAAAYAVGAPTFASLGIIPTREDQTALTAADEYTGFLNEENHLDWQDAFHRGGTGYIDGITPQAMKKSFMWGIDRWNRAFIALKLKCTRVVEGGAKAISEGSTAIFQRYTGKSMVVPGSHFMPKGCPDLGPLDPLQSRNFKDSLEHVLKGGKVEVTNRWLDDSSYTLELANGDAPNSVQHQLEL